jgi:hypothetical protein
MAACSGWPLAKQAVLPVGILLEPHQRLRACRNYYTPSSLYGCDGELWKADGRLPDFSYAGAPAVAAVLHPLPETASTQTIINTGC